jgi:hypothetical protein
MSKSESNQLQLSDLAALIPKPVTALVSLPSKGLFYRPEQLTEGKVEVAPMSAREEKLVAGMRGSNIEEVIDSLLSRCIKSPITPDELIVTDRFYLLLALRANSYGETYPVELTCPYCEVKGKYEIKIPGELEVQEALPEDREPFRVKLPSGIIIGFRLLRGKDLKDIKNNSEKAVSKGWAGEGEPSYLYRLAKQIVSVNGKTLDMLVAQELVSRLSARDSACLKNAYDKKTPGVITTIKKSCVSCTKEIQTELPMTAEFFRPEYGGEEILNG